MIDLVAALRGVVDVLESAEIDYVGPRKPAERSQSRR